MIDDGLYPEIEPYYTDVLDCDGHKLYYELSGNPNGPTALFLHGGPGGGTSPRVRRFFNPKQYRIVLLDQRGAGKSTPNVSKNYEAALYNNTTAHLVADIEALRDTLALDTWRLILGGSWGSTLALAYAQAYPRNVQQLLLRGVFTFLPDEVDGLFQNGRAADHYPEEWQAYVQYIKETSDDWTREQQNLIGAYQNRLQNPVHRMNAAKAFVTYELSISHLYKNQQRIDSVMQTPEILVPFAALEIHYMLNYGFMNRGALLDNIAVLKDHRIHIVHGRNDAVCLPKAASRLYSALIGAGAKDNVTLEFIQAAGHSDGEEPIAKALAKATDALVK
ncbi:MAG: prolyl aminopeptidase [Deltaproteobacteria bacterium]|nr:prolyl aminopeptidase [Deltaproteobacteria bacterium]